MRRIALIILVLLLIVGGFFGWLFLGSATGFKPNVKYLYIPSGTTSEQDVMNLLEKDSIVVHEATFSWLANRMSYWQNIKPGKYKINHGESVVSIVKKLKNGQQDPVNIVILKFRTREALAGAIGKKLECDSSSILGFMNSADSLKPYGLDTNTVMTAIFPDTYTHFWNTTPKKVFGKFYDAYKQVWTEDRKRKAAAHGLTTASAYTLASIIEEETNDKEDKPLMASVYLNRIKKGMTLGADPTVKFALRDFGLKRLYNKHTTVESPYNTYRVQGLPPGPICTPTLETLDAVLNAPSTEYLFFVAKSDFSGKHVFTTNYEDHLKYRDEFARAQDERGIR